MQITCQHCNGTSYYIKKKGATQVGLYCKNSHCGRWIKWVGKKQLQPLTGAGYRIHEEHEQVKMVETERTYSTLQEDSLPDDFNSSSPSNTGISIDGYQQAPQQTLEEPLTESDFLYASTTPAPVTCAFCTGVPLTEEGGIEVSINKAHKLLILSRLSTGAVISSAPISCCPYCGGRL